MADVLKKAVTLFYSYAPTPKDEVLRGELEKHLVGLQRKGLIESWSRRDIVAGKHQQEEINTHLEQASVILLLISPDFLASDYHYSTEMMRSMEWHSAGDARVIPILLRPVYLEDEPFTHLASLPTNGRPISMWRNRDAAFADIAKEISKSIRSLHGPSAATDPVQHNPFRFVHDPLNYFTQLETFLDGEGRWLQEDYERGRIYSPEKEYFAQIEKVLNAKHQVLLLGRGAAGKTVLALTFAKHLQEHAGYRVGYKDVKQAEAGDGRKWYALAREHDQSGSLYILDNCHLASREVGEFCRQWKDQPPTHAQCLLISRIHLQETHTEESSYLHMFSDDEKIQVRSEDIFLQVIEQYVTSLRQHVSEYEDVLKSDDVTTLEKQHAHNLVISRSRLDVWETLGPHSRLSEVRQEDLYQALETKYFATYGPALATLCVLQRYEIRAHTFFVKNLPQDEIRRLQQEKLLIHSTVAGYGQLYDLILHPTEARELFLAHVFNQYGRVTQENIHQLVISTLEAYLSAKPLNYIALYDSLARQKHEDILKQLLLNRDLQERTADQFNKETLVDAIRYVYKVARLDREGATQLMKRVVRVAGIQDIRAKLLKSSFQDGTVLLQAMKYIDAELAQEVVTTLDVKQLALRMAEENVQDLFRLVRSVRALSPVQATFLLSSVATEELITRTTVRNYPDMVKQLRAYEYSQEQTTRFVDLLDMQQFAQQCDNISLQSLFWTLHALEKLSSRQAHTLLHLLPSWKLAMKASVSNIGSIDQTMQLMQRIGCTHGQMVEFVELLDIDIIGLRARQGSLRRFASFLRTLRAISVPIAATLLEVVTPAAMAMLCHVKETSLADLEQFRKASTRAFWEAFMQHCSAQDIAELFQRTTLGAVGTFFYYQRAFRTVQEGYRLFQEQFLLTRLATEPLNKLGEFLDRLSSVPHEGPRLAHDALALLVTTNLTKRIVSTNLLHFALLLHHARSIDTNLVFSLLAPLRQPAVLQSALTTSDIHGIQLLIFNISTIDTEYLYLIHQGLQNSNIAERLESASIKDVGRFLWNVYSYIDKDMAQQYCTHIDTRLQTQQLQGASPEDLCFFLWNLTSIISSQEIRIFHHSVILRVLREGWVNEIGWSMVLAGIATTAHVTALDGTFLQSIRLHENALTQWFAMKNGGRNPYFLALALKGLRHYNERTAQTIVRNILSLTEALQLLESARPSAITAYSIQLLEEIIQWITGLLEEDKR